MNQVAAEYLGYELVVGTLGFGRTRRWVAIVRSPIGAEVVVSSQCRNKLAAVNLAALTVDIRMRIKKEAA